MKYLLFKSNKINLPIILLACLSILLSSCGAKSDVSEETKTGVTPKDTLAEVTNNEAAGVAKEVQISDQQYKAINIQLSTIEKKNLADVLKATGFLSVPPQSKASITSTLGGTIKSIYVQEGSNVRKGQTLVTIVNPEFVKMQQDYLEAQAQLSLAQANYKRQQELAKENVSAQRVLQEATSNYKSLVARVNSLKSQFGLIGINTSSISDGNIVSSISIKSPINGTVAKVNVNLGLTIDPSTTLMELVDNSHLHLDLFVYEQDLPKVKVGQNVDFSLTNLPDKNFEAKIYSIGSAFENETKSIPVHAELKGGYSNNLIEGMNVTGLINIGENVTSAVLSNAVASYSGNDYIFIQKQDTTAINNKNTIGVEKFVFERIRIKKGITSGGYTEITPLEEIPENSKVVTNGAFYLMAILTNAGEEE